ncbi:MAG: RNA 3'-phosphate cyclase [Anaerolineae bacterium]|nr:RNA 3'-phosphate cyclase [Anaerolineae bacterium]
MITIDGTYGEGGGQIIRTSLTLAALLTRPLHIKNIRAGRKNPGLAAQHLTAVRAAAALCGAALRGDHLGSMELIFEPQQTPIRGAYRFDIAEAREGGSAGAATLVLQTVLLPLTVADGNSRVLLKGGTHVPWSPSFHYVQQVFLPLLARCGYQVTSELEAWGWYPAGQGRIKAEITGHGGFKHLRGRDPFVRGDLKNVTGLAVASSLPSHIAQRMGQRAANRLVQAGLPASITPQRVRSVSPGAGIFLTAEYESSQAGFGSIGKKGKPSEAVADEAVDALLAFHQTGATFDKHLTDQMLLPLVISGHRGTIAVESLTRHTMTNMWVIEQFLGPVIKANPRNNTLEFFERL